MVNKLFIFLSICFIAGNLIYTSVSGSKTEKLFNQNLENEYLDIVNTNENELSSIYSFLHTKEGTFRLTYSKGFLDLFPDISVSGSAKFNLDSQNVKKLIKFMDANNFDEVYSDDNNEFSISRCYVKEDSINSFHHKYYSIVSFDKKDSKIEPNSNYKFLKPHFYYNFNEEFFDVMPAGNGIFNWL